jgi:protein-disulfide isomerase
MLLSTFWSVKGVYNFYLYGSCNGLNQGGFCVFDPTGENNKISQISTQCSTEKPSEKNLTLSGVDLSSFPIKNINTKDKIVFIGCYECDYSRKTYPLIQKLVEKYNVSFTFAHFPIKSEFSTLSKLGYCAYQQDQNKFWQLNGKIFSSDKKDIENPDYVVNLVAELGYDAEALKSCVNSPTTQEVADSQLVELQKTHLYGTPTIFINGQVFVGSKPYRVYERALRGWRFW